MEFTCQKESILEYILMTDYITNNKLNFSINSSILLDLKENNLTIKAINSECSFQAKLTVKTIKEGSIAVSQSKLSSILQQMNKEEEILFKYDEKIFEIKSLTKSKAKYQLIGIPASEFPQEEINTQENSWVIEGEQFKKMIQKTTFCVAGSQNLESNISGVSLKSVNSMLVMVATDARRLSHFSASLSDVEDFESILSPTILNHLNKMIKKETVIKCSFKEGQFYFSFDHAITIKKWNNEKQEEKEIKIITPISFICNTINGNFIDYSVFVKNDNYPYTLKCNSQDLVRIVDQATPINEKNDTNKLIFDLTKNNIRVSSENKDNEDFEGEIFAEYENEDLKVGINGDYLKSILNSIDTESVVIHIESPAKPILIKELDREEFFYILMPIRID